MANGINNNEEALSFKEEFKKELAKQNVPSFLTHPTRTDKYIFLAFIGMTIFSYAMLPLRVWFINNPEAYSFIIGGYTSAIILGSEQSTGSTTWPFVLLGLFGGLKFLIIYYFIGKHWGKSFLMFTTQGMPRLNRKLDNIVTHKKDKLKTFGFLITPLAHLPAMRISDAITVTLLVLAKVRFRYILFFNAICLLIVNYTFFYLGYIFGEQVIDIIEIINKYTGWVFFALIFGTVFWITYHNSKNNHDKHGEENK